MENVIPAYLNKHPLKPHNKNLNPKEEKILLF